MRFRGPRSLAREASACSGYCDFHRRLCILSRRKFKEVSVDGTPSRDVLKPHLLVSLSYTSLRTSLQTYIICQWVKVYPSPL